MRYTRDQEIAIMHDQFVSVLSKIDMQDEKIVMGALDLLSNDIDRIAWNMMRDLIEYIRDYNHGR